MEQFPRAVRRMLLDLGVEQTLADKLIGVEGEKGQKGEGTKGKGTGNKGGVCMKGGGKKGKGKW